jgi:hypothetical protein
MFLAGFIIVFPYDVSLVTWDIKYGDRRLEAELSINEEKYLAYQI